MKISFVDLQKQYQIIKEEIRKEIQEVLDSGQYTLGKKVENFEKEFAEYCGAKYCLGVNSGTSAVHIALLGCGIGEEDEVITQPNTFFATAEAISYTGAKPVFVDINSDTHGIDVSKIEGAVTSKTKCIIPVHLYGNGADMDKINEIAQRHNLTVIEDACQGHGALYQGKKLGTFGKAGCFSFYPAKVLGAYGEGGAVITDDKELHERMKAFRDHGQFEKNKHQFIGHNYRMGGMQGAVLGVKLKYLDEWVSKRREIAKLYNEQLKGKVKVPLDSSLANSNFQYYVIRCQSRDELRDYLSQNGVTALIHYPIPIHLQESYKFLGYKEGDFPVAEKVVKEILSLPMYPELEKEQVHYVTNLINKFYNK